MGVLTSLKTRVTGSARFCDQIAGRVADFRRLAGLIRSKPLVLYDQIENQLDPSNSISEQTLITGSTRSTDG